MAVDITTEHRAGGPHVEQLIARQRTSALTLPDRSDRARAMLEDGL